MLCQGSDLPILKQTPANPRVVLPIRNESGVQRILDNVLDQLVHILCTPHTMIVKRLLPERFPAGPLGPNMAGVGLEPLENRDQVLLADGYNKVNMIRT